MTSGIRPPIDTGPPPVGPPPGTPPGSAPAATPSWLETSGAEEQATPEEQDLYETFVGTALKMIYNEKTFDGIKKMLDQPDDPIAALAQTAAMVVHRTKEMAAKAGKEIPGDIMLHGGAEIYEDLAELSTRMGVYDITGDQKAFDSGWLMALDVFRSMDEPNIDKGAMVADFQQIQAADKSGALKVAMQDMARRSKAQPAPAANALPEGPPPTGLAPMGRP